MVKMANNFQDVDVNMLTLWRVLNPNNMQNTVVTLDKLEDKTGLTDPRARVSTLIPEVPDGNTFIFVQRLPQGNANAKDLLKLILALTMVLSTRVILQLAIVAVMMLVVSAGSGPLPGCYRACIKDGGKASYCQSQCFDSDCYRVCVKNHEPPSYCARSCVY
ncbi:hypothetical protein BGW41_005899 [Actinomortierella wolfii]|nr:hypothetical protein BGW41_005899 [Actinomortierella wolfii]